MIVDAVSKHFTRQQEVSGRQAHYVQVDKDWYMLLRNYFLASQLCYLIRLIRTNLEFFKIDKEL